MDGVESGDPVATFRAGLQRLYGQARRPTYRSLEAHADREGLRLRTSTLGDLLNGPRTPRWETVESFVRACAAYARAHRIDLTETATDLDVWHARYREMENDLADRDGRGGDGGSGTGGGTGGAGGGTGGRRRAMAVVPAQLPADLPAFAGRQEQLAQLDKLLADSGQFSRRGAAGRPVAVVITAIAGTAGVGKTALAIQWAHRMRERFPDGQLYVNLRGFDGSGQVVAASTAVRGFLDAFQVPRQRIPADLDAQAALYRSLLTDRRVLIILDNARDSAQVRPLLPGSPGSFVIVTSRNRLTGLIAANAAHPLEVDLLSTMEARDLLAGRLGADRVAAEPEAVDELIGYTSCLPLALAVVAARAATNRHHSLSDVAAQLRDARTRLDALSGDDPASNLRAVFSWSYHTLSDETARLFRLLGLHGGPDITVRAASSLAARPVDQVRAGLEELARGHLVVEHRPGRYTFHDLLREYARQLAQSLDSEEEQTAATRRVLDHYLHTAFAAERLLYPFREPIALPPPENGARPEELSGHAGALAWFHAEHAVLLAAVDRAAATGFDTHVWRLAWTLGNFLLRQGHWYDRVEVQRAAVAAARRAGDRAAEVQARRNLGDAHSYLGRFDAAEKELQEALELADDGAHLDRALIHLSLTFLLERQARHEPALENALRAFDLFQSLGNEAGQANSLNAIGWVCSQLGDYPQALARCEHALALQRKSGDRYGQAETWDSLGYIHHHLGDERQAIACYREALALFQDLGDRHNEAETLNHLGDTEHALGDEGAARAAWRQALAIFTELDHPEADTVRGKLRAA